ncbi:MAG TPA: hypothetical protein VJ911_02250, partial [Cryomorphaceae bacterium]|nr:hypothetical protein [Cryomorphaceae bacterium]
TIAICAIILLFAAVVIIQMRSAQTTASPRWQKWAIHVRNGLYANAMYDRLVGALQIQKPENSTHHTVQKT